MASCIVDNCNREPEDDSAKDPICFYHRIRTITFDYSHLGQLRNRLHPGLTGRESQRKIVEDAKAGGHDVVPVDSGTWT